MLSLLKTATTTTTSTTTTDSSNITIINKINKTKYHMKQRYVANDFRVIDFEFGHCVFSQAA